MTTETTTYRAAIATALRDAMRDDDRVFLLGEDVGAAGGVFKASEGLLEEFGVRRVRDTPISETAIVGAAIGAAVMGLRPVAEVMFADFAGTCFDQIANQLAKYRYMSGGQAAVPVTVRLSNGAGGGFGSQHSQPVENWFLNIPGLKIAVPSTPHDVYVLLRAAIEDEDPVLVFEHKGLFSVKGRVGDGIDGGLGRAEVVRPGRDVTVVATQLMRWRALEAAERLAGEGMECEVIDLRTLVPLDVDTVAESVVRTSRLACVQEASAAGSWGASLVATVAGAHFDALDGAPLLVAADDTPIPYAEPLESAWMPTVERITDAVRRLVRY